MSDEHISFLMHFYPRLYGLPGGMEQNGQLRMVTAHLLLDYPESLASPTACIDQFFHEHRPRVDELPYKGDLETDFLRFLAETQRLAMTRVGAEADFGTIRHAC